ncbi:MAG: hypothetical protein WCC84_14555 [Candidatus Cybelea sp.]
MVRKYGTAAILLTLLATQRNVAVANDTARLTPDQIYWRAQATVDRLTQPAYVAFTFENQGLAIDGLSLNPHKTPHPSRELLRVLVRTSDGRAAVCAFKDQRGRDIAHPSVGIVTDPIGWTVLTNITRLGDFPLADFGLRYGSESRPGFFEAYAPSPRASPLRVIARVVALAPPPYRIVDLGDTTIDDRPVYHLGLAPIRNPEHNVLRQIWVDKTTFLPVRYVAIRTVLEVPEPFSYAVTVDSTEIDGHLVNVDANGVSVDGLGKWRIFQISFPDAEPDWVFDPALWPRHNGEQIPNLAANIPAPR